MPSGIFGATITNITNGTTANAPDVLNSLNSLKSNGLNNDGALIQTDGSGNIIGPNGQFRSTFILATPYHLTTNPTVNNGSTTNLTCTGVGSIPSGAIAVWIACEITCSVAATVVNIYPTGSSQTGYPAISAPVVSQFYYVPVLAPLSTGGQVTVKSTGGNTVLQDWYIYGYVI